jgi:hypothetical protein
MVLQTQRFKSFLKFIDKLILLLQGLDAPEVCNQLIFSSMLIQKSCGKLHASELDIVGFLDELGSDLLVLPRDGCAHNQARC